MALHDCYQLFYGTFMFFFPLFASAAKHSFIDAKMSAWDVNVTHPCVLMSHCVTLVSRQQIGSQRTLLVYWALGCVGRSSYRRGASVSNAGDDMSYPLFCLTSCSLCCSVQRTHNPFPTALWTQRRVQKLRLNVLFESKGDWTLVIVNIYCAFRETLKESHIVCWERSERNKNIFLFWTIKYISPPSFSLL